MSALGQKQTLTPVRAMSALPPKADIAEIDEHVRFVPKADVTQLLRIGAAWQRGKTRRVTFVSTKIR